MASGARFKVEPEDRLDVAIYWLRAARKRLDDADALIRTNVHWVGAILLCQAAVELSLKAAEILAIGECQKEHYFPNKDINDTLRAMKEVPPEIGQLSWQRCFQAANRLARFRTDATYGQAHSPVDLEYSVSADDAKQARKDAADSYWAGHKYVMHVWNTTPEPERSLHPDSPRVPMG